MSEAQLVRTIKAHIAKGDQAKEKADQHYIAAGRYLSELRETIADQETFLKISRDEIGIGKSRTYELLAIGDGRKTIDDTRAETAERVRKHEALCPLPNGQADVESIEETPRLLAPIVHEEQLGEPDDDAPGDDDETIWRRGLLFRAGEASRYATFEKSWDEFTVDQELVRAARQAADAWEKLASYLNRRLQHAKAAA